MILTALMLVACSPTEELRFTATLEADVNGLRLTPDGLDAVAAMAGTTCTIDTNWGCPVADVDLPTSGERIDDVYQGEAIGVSDEGVHVIRGQAWVETEDLALSGVHMAGWAEGGFVTVAGTEQSCIFRLGEQTVEAAGEACATGMTYAYDRAGERVFAAGNGQVLLLTAEGSSVVSDAHDLAAWDDTTSALFVARSGGFEVARMGVDGASAWTVDTDGPVVSLAARGDLGQAVVLTETTDGYGLVERLDGVDGRRLGSGRVPDANRTLEISGNGVKLAMISEGEVHFYEMAPDVEFLPVDDSPVECIVPTQTRRVTD